MHPQKQNVCASCTALESITDCENAAEDESNIVNEVYKVITDRILSLLEKGTVPWHKPWNGGEYAPQSLVTKKPYRGINMFSLSSAGYEQPFWLTYKQAVEKGGLVKKGERGFPIVYWKWVKDSGSDATKKEVKRQHIVTGYPLYFTVFNVEQCSDIKYPTIEVKENRFTPLEQCEQVVREMPNAPRIDTTQTKAFYRPLEDMVGMPRPERFDRQEDFYSTLFHELIHSTGHESRLKRKGIMEVTQFGGNDYSKEELIAEMGGTFLNGHCGIEDKVIDNSASYINHWLGNLKKDSGLVVHAASQGQKACDYILRATYQNGHDVEGESEDLARKLNK